MSGASSYLDVADVLDRYGLRDPRAARRLMDEAGAFVVGRRLLVRPDDLERHEEELRAQRRAQVAGQSPGPTRRRRGRRTPSQDLSHLAADWLDEVAL
jgi:hypothetical protein